MKMISGFPRFSIRRESLAGYEGYHYDISYSDLSRPAGVVDIFFDALRSIHDTESYEQLIVKSLAPETRIAELAAFYPNWLLKDEDVERYTKKGVGSEVLNKVIEDSLAHGCKAMFVFTSKPWMKSFLELKHGFSHANPLEYYKLL